MMRQAIKHRLYPPNWKKLARHCKEQACWTCEHCGVRQHESRLSRRGIPYYIYLHAAHAHHDTGNPTPDLIALCISCHARYDYQHKQREARIALERLKHQRAWVQRDDRRWY